MKRLAVSVIGSLVFAGLTASAGGAPSTPVPTCAATLSTTASVATATVTAGCDAPDTFFVSWNIPPSGKQTFVAETVVHGPGTYTVPLGPCRWQIDLVLRSAPLPAGTHLKIYRGLIGGTTCITTTTSTTTIPTTTTTTVPVTTTTPRTTTTTVKATTTTTKPIAATTTLPATTTTSTTLAAQVTVPTTIAPTPPPVPLPVTPPAAVLAATGVPVLPFLIAAAILIITGLICLLLVRRSNRYVPQHMLPRRWLGLRNGVQ